MRDPLIRVFQAYRAGILKKPEAGTVQDHSESFRVRSWEALHLQACIGQVSLEGRHWFRKLTKISYQGLLAAREGDLDGARSCFDQSFGLLDQVTEEPVRTMILGFMCGNIAYLEHRLGNFAQANRHVETSLEADLALEEDFGLSMYQMHRIQLGHNLARIHCKREEWRRASALCGALVGFLDGQLPELPYHRSWHAARLSAVPRFLVQAMMYQIAEDASRFLVWRGEESGWRAFFEATRLASDPRDLHYLQPGIWGWFRAKKAYLDGDMERYFSLLEQTLPGGPRDLGTIFYSALTDFVDVCSYRPESSAERVQEVLRKDSAKWKMVPWMLAERLAQPLEEAVQMPA